MAANSLIPIIAAFFQGCYDLHSRAKLELLPTTTIYCQFVLCWRWLTLPFSSFKHNRLNVLLCKLRNNNWTNFLIATTKLTQIGLCLALLTPQLVSGVTIGPLAVFNSTYFSCLLLCSANELQSDTARRRHCIGVCSDGLDSHGYYLFTLHYNCYFLLHWMVSSQMEHGMSFNNALITFTRYGMDTSLWSAQCCGCIHCGGDGITRIGVTFVLQLSDCTAVSSPNELQLNVTITLLCWWWLVDNCSCCCNPLPLTQRHFHFTAVNGTTLQLYL